MTRQKQILTFVLVFLLSFVLNKLIFELVTDKIPILGFHDIVDIQEINVNLSQDKNLIPAYRKEDLEEFLDYLVREDYWFLSTQELYDYFLTNPHQPIPGKHQNQKKVMITFDDGYESVYSQVMPILENLEKKYGRKVKVVLFVNSGFMGNRGSQLDHANCKELNEGLIKGFYDIQSHGLHHHNFTELSETDLERELLEDQNRLRKCTDGLDKDKTVASHIAYPFGAVNDKVEEYVNRYYSSGYLYNSKMLTLGWNKNQYAIPRLTVNMKKSVNSLIRLASGGWF